VDKNNNLNYSECVISLKNEALSLGFSDIKITSTDPIPHLKKDLAEFIKQKKHQDMIWMAETYHRRIAPKHLWPEAKSLIMVAVNYGQKSSPLYLLDKKDRGYISLYARGSDYHKILKKRLRILGEWLVQNFGGSAKMFVDTAPLMEKPLAQKAGLGWQGLHTNLVSKELGSWFFLGCLATSLALPIDSPEINHCGTCRSCEEACPTSALQDGKIDPGLCIAYLTVEHKGYIPDHLAEKFGNRIFGCDDCLAVCPWNKFTQPSDESFHSRIENQAPYLDDLLKLNDDQFRKIYSGSPIKRLGLVRFHRNVLIAIGNSENPQYLPLLREFLGKNTDIILQKTGLWAIKKLSLSE
jgi:epoxyqueuosine reductase